MSKKYTVAVVQYKEEDEGTVKALVKSITEPINAKHGEVRLAYQSSEERIIVALQNILKLAKQCKFRLVCLAAPDCAVKSMDAVECS